MREEGGDGGGEELVRGKDVSHLRRSVLSRRLPSPSGLG